jgi:hypothetical protein
VGEVAVEALRPGDVALTADGDLLPVRWVGRSVIARAFADPDKLLPVRIRASARPVRFAGARLGGLKRSRLDLGGHSRERDGGYAALRHSCAGTPRRAPPPLSDGRP